MMTLDELRKLDPKDIGNWPALPKFGALLLALLVILAAAYLLDWQSQLDSISEAERKEILLRQNFLDKKKQAINLAAYRQQLADIEKSFGVLLKQLPGRSEMDALLTDINQAGLGRGMQFDLFKPAASEIESEFYAELPINLRVTGSYHDMGSFATAISKLSRIVLLTEINLTQIKDGVLAMDAVARTFRYLDEEEIAKKKKAEKDAKTKAATNK